MKMMKQLLLGLPLFWCVSLYGGSFTLISPSDAYHTNADSGFTMAWHKTAAAAIDSMYVVQDSIKGGTWTDVYSAAVGAVNETTYTWDAAALTADTIYSWRVIVDTATGTADTLYSDTSDIFTLYTVTPSIWIDLNSDVAGREDTLWVYSGDTLIFDIYAKDVYDLDAYDFYLITDWDSAGLIYNEVRNGAFLASDGGTDFFQKDTLYPDTLWISNSLQADDTTENPDGEGIIAYTGYVIIGNTVDYVDSLYFGNTVFYTCDYLGAAGEQSIPTITPTDLTGYLKWGSAGDFDRDGDVDLTDLGLLRGKWHTTLASDASYKEKYDVYETEGNDTVDFWDAKEWLDTYYTTDWIKGDWTGKWDGYDWSAPDNYVDIFDLNALADRWHRTGTALDTVSPSGFENDSIFDLVSDDVLDIKDLNIFADNWHTGTYAPIQYEKGYSPPTVGSISFNAEIPNANREFDVSIVINGVKGVRSYTFDIVYDPKTLELVNNEVLEGPFLSENSHESSTFFIADRQEGMVNVSASILGDGSSLMETGVLATMRFRVTSNAQTTLEIKNVLVWDANRSVTTCPKCSYSVQEGSIGSGIASSYVTQNIPNPFSSVTSIQYQTARNNSVSLKVYDLTGKLVRTLVDARQTPGCYTAFWNRKDNLGKQVPTGIYFYKLSIGNRTLTQKMVVLK